MALILGFSYDDYQKIISFLFKKTSDRKLEQTILNDLLSYMTPVYYQFWQEIFDYYFDLQQIYQREIHLFQILTQDYYFDLEEIKFFNHYLAAKENYERTKQNLANIKVSFTLKNLFSYTNNKEYDLILCSNILEYFYHPNLDIKKLHELYQPLINQLKEKGIIYANYIYGLYIHHELRSYPIGGTNITGRELLKEEILLVPDYRKEDQNGVLVLRKTKPN